VSTYRTGNHQPQNVYRDDAYIGVMFTAEDAALVVEALNGIERAHGPALPIVDSCTCAPFDRTGFNPDPNCPVHQGRKARGPKPPALGAGCICDGSGRTCPRHGVVL
jgi:hypothetical protein